MKLVNYFKDHLKSILVVLEIIVSVFLIILILIQSKGTSVAEIFGGSGSFYMTKRGIEKKLHILTIILVCLFFVLALASLKVK